MNDLVHPEIHALDALLDETVARAEAAARSESADRMLFLGNRHHAFPSAIIKDPVLEPVDKMVWMVIMLQVQETGGNTAFPGYGSIGRIANISSRSTIARAIAILRATRWLTLCRQVRKPSGQFCGNVYALHDEPLPLADACHLDAGYLAFLRKAIEHAHARVRAVAQGVLHSIDEDIERGLNVLDQVHPIDCRIKSVAATATGGHRRFFSFTRNAVRQLRKDLVTAQPMKNDHDQNSNMERKDRVRISNSVGSSSSYINITTTTHKGVSKSGPGGEDGQPLVYPGRLGENHREIANRYLDMLSPEQRQPILDELEGRFQAEQKGMTPVYDDIRFLGSLCRL
ncbi:MAG: helix-turn-helix domain-containing protein, partial [Gammaproteobacteria bacterium]|nr:helix-turn-helix domain-containing protein [Gammaproteobacteria bacterium]